MRDISLSARLAPRRRRGGLIQINLIARQDLIRSPLCSVTYPFPVPIQERCMASVSFSRKPMIARIRAMALSGMFLLGCIVACAVSVLAQPQSTVSLRAARVLDGRGGAWDNAVIEIAGSKITKIEQRAGTVTYDLGNATLLPGLIDVHVHPLAYLGADPRPGFRSAQTAEMRQQSARATLMAGFTTVQSAGDIPEAFFEIPKAMRDAIATGLIIGPRLLTALGQIHPGNRSSDELRAEVRRFKAAGADLIKLYGSQNGVTGHAANVTLEQMVAVCGEAKIQGLRCVVHAHPAEAIINAVKAGATQIEHGGWADSESVKAMADGNVLYDPTMSVPVIAQEHRLS
jgi:imidazolonepropionase-like amidohydrolase